MSAESAFSYIMAMNIVGLGVSCFRPIVIDFAGHLGGAVVGYAAVKLKHI